MIEITGMKELQKLFTEMPTMLETELKNAVNDMGDVVLKRAQQKAPGGLKSGMAITKATNKNGIITGYISLKKGYGYGVPVELGHKLVAWGHKTDKHIKEQPYMRPAADESVNEVEKIALAVTDRVMGRFSE